MSIGKARAFLQQKGLEDRIIEPEESTATVELAAQAVGVQPGQIAKTLSFLVDGQPILVLAEGTSRIVSSKFKAAFHKKPKMIPFDEVEGYIGHAPGGVCPFGVNEGVPVFLDESLKKHELVFPAAGNDHSAVRLTPDELYACSDAAGWVDVCKEG